MTVVGAAERTQRNSLIDEANLRATYCLTTYCEQVSE